MDWILLLALVTFLCVLAFLVWTKTSAARHNKASENAVGGLNDPLSGTAPGIRDPDTLRASLDQAAAAPSRSQ
jgi:hypothetical protein